MTTKKKLNGLLVIGVFSLIISCGKKPTIPIPFEEPLVAVPLEELELEDEFENRNSEVVDVPKYVFQKVLSYDELRNKLKYLDGKGFLTRGEKRNTVLRIKVGETYVGVNSRTYPEDDVIYYYDPLTENDHLEKLNYIGEYSDYSMFTLDKGNDTLILNVSKTQTSNKEWKRVSVKLLSDSPWYDLLELKNNLEIAERKEFFLKALVNYDLTYKDGKLIYYIRLKKYEKLDDKVIFKGEMSEYFQYEKVDKTPQDMIISMSTGNMVATSVQDVVFIYENDLPFEVTTVHTLSCKQGFIVDLEIYFEGDDDDGYSLYGKAMSGGKKWDMKAIQRSPF